MNTVPNTKAQLANRMYPRRFGGRDVWAPSRRRRGLPGIAGILPARVRSAKYTISVSNGTRIAIPAGFSDVSRVPGALPFAGAHRPNGLGPHLRISPVLPKQALQSRPNARVSIAHRSCTSLMRRAANPISFKGVACVFLTNPCRSTMSPPYTVKNILAILRPVKRQRASCNPA